MAGVKISALPAGDPLDGSELIAVVQGGVTRRSTTSDLGVLFEVSSNKDNDPTLADDSATKYPTQQAVRAYVGGYLPKAGGTMTGAIAYTAATATTIASSSKVTGDANNRWQRQIGGAQLISNGTDVPKTFLRCDGEAASRKYTNTWLGYGAGELYGAQSNNAGYACTGVGYQALGSLTGVQSAYGEGNTAFGYAAGGLLTYGDRNTLVGVQAGGGMTTDRFATLVGYHAGLGITSGSTGATCLGYFAGEQATVALTALGYLAGRMTTGVANTYVGHQAGQTVTSGANNTALGNSALGGATAITGSANTCVGYRAGFAIQGAAQYNVLVGGLTGGSITTGSRNFVIGASVGPSTGSDNIVFGHLLTLPSQTASGQMNFFGVITGTGLASPSTALMTFGTAAGGVGFYGTAGVVKQTGVAVTAAAIHAALVNLGLIAA